MTLARKRTLLLRWIICSAFVAYRAAAADPPSITEYPVESIPMRLEIELNANRFLVGENFPVTTRIVNPNGFDVHLSGFDFGPMVPHLEILAPDRGGFRDISLGATIRAIGGPLVTIPAKGHLEHRHLVFDGTRLGAWGWLNMSAGRYSLRLKPLSDAVSPTDPDKYTKITWVADVAQFALIPPSGRNAVALEYMKKKAQEFEQHVTNPDPQKPSASLLQLEFYRAFLEDYSDTVYASAVHLRGVRLLAHEIQDPHGPHYRDPKMIERWDASLKYCLDLGGAYAEEFVQLAKGDANNAQIQLAERFQRIELLKAIIKGIDEKYPEDEPGRLYRRAILKGYTESPEEARKAARSVQERYPNTRCAAHANSLIESIDRGTWPLKPPDAETLAYESAIIISQRQTPEEARKTLRAVLERFPQGPHADAIEQVLIAIDEGSWPPKAPSDSTSTDETRPRSDE